MEATTSFKQNNALEFLKFFAALLITNSHFGNLYGKYSILATGGAIGDSLFFFCSGIALSYARFDRFDNWYKRRVFRIYPSVISTNIISIITGLTLSYSTVYQPFTGGGWFFRAILIFYLILYGLSHFSVKNLRIILSVTIIGLLASSFFLIKSPEDVYSSGSYYAWGVYFTTFLFGFICGKGSILNKKHVTYKGIVILIICITMYYGYLACCNRFSELLWLRILSIFPLYGILVFFYLSCDSTNASKLLTSKYNFPIIFISSLCWEIYLAQLFIVLPYPGLFTRNLPLPINIFATFALILVVAYVIKVLSRFIIQIFSRDKFDWTYMVQIWKR